MCTAAAFPLISASWLLCASCNFASVPVYQGDPLLQGTWRSVLTKRDTNFLLSRAYNFVIRKDSIYLQIHSRAEAPYYGDECFGGGEWDEFGKGTYRKANDTLVIDGFFTHANFHPKVSGCLRNGNFRITFRIQRLEKNMLTLRNTEEHGLLSLTKI